MVTSSIGPPIVDMNDVTLTLLLVTKPTLKK